MVIPLIPIVLASVLSAGPVALGLIEGVADAIASFLKLWAGRHSDHLGGKRKGLTFTGYTLSNITRPLLGLVGSWPAVLLLRSLDRVGKGIRSAPRDAMLADATPPGMLGRAYGFHRMLDNGGAVAGALLAAAILASGDFSLTQVILLSSVPGGIVLALLFLVKEPPPKARSARPPIPPLAWAALPPVVRRYLPILMLFTFARASETFIVLLGHQMGLDIVHLLLLWAALNLCKAVTSSLGGHAADRIGRVRVMLMSWVAFGFAFGMLGQVGAAKSLWVVTLFYGLAAGFGEGAERALIVDLASEESRGTVFGWYYLSVGIAAIPAGVVFGVIWQWAGSAVAFSMAGVAAIVSALLLRTAVVTESPIAQPYPRNVN